MFQITSFRELKSELAMFDAMQINRREQFVERLKWKLDVDDRGREIDEYDDDEAGYCLVRNGGKHIASLRFRRMSSPNMIQDHFEHLVPKNFKIPSNCLEVTRFCIARGISSNFALLSLSDLSIGFCRYCSRNNISNLLALTYKSQLKCFERISWEPEVINSCPSDDGDVILVKWSAHESMLWDLQEKRIEIEERLSRRAFAPSRQEERDAA